MSERVNTAAPEAQAAMNLSQNQLRQLAQQDLLVGATFAKIVSLLMRSPGHRGATLADLDWLVVPPLMAGQFAILDGLIDGVATASSAAHLCWPFLPVPIFTASPHLIIRTKPLPSQV